MFNLTSYIIKIIDGEEHALPNKEYWDEMSRKKYKIHLESSGIPRNYWDINFDDYHGEISLEDKNKALEYALNCKDKKFRQINLYLVGNHGTQKSTVACNIGKEFIKQGYRVQFTYASELIDILLKVQGFSYIEELEKELKKFTSADLLIIDDIFDVHKGTYWQSNPQLIISAWDKFLRRQISENKRTILTSNFPLSTIEEKFGQSLFNLLDRNFYTLMFYDNVSEVRKSRFKELFDVTDNS